MMDIKDVAKEIEHYTYNVTDQAGNELSVVDSSDIMVVLTRLKLVKKSASLPFVSVSTVKLLSSALKDLLEEVDREGWNINGNDYQEQTNARKALAQVPNEYLR